MRLAWNLMFFHFSARTTPAVQQAQQYCKCADYSTELAYHCVTFRLHLASLYPSVPPVRELSMGNCPSRFMASQPGKAAARPEGPPPSPSSLKGRDQVRHQCRLNLMQDRGFDTRTCHGVMVSWHWCYGLPMGQVLYSFLRGEKPDDCEGGIWQRSAAWNGLGRASRSFKIHQDTKVWGITIWKLFISYMYYFSIYPCHIRSSLNVDFWTGRMLDDILRWDDRTMEAQSMCMVLLGWMRRSFCRHYFVTLWYAAYFVCRMWDNVCLCLLCRLLGLVSELANGMDDIYNLVS